MILLPNPRSAKFLDKKVSIASEGTIVLKGDEEELMPVAINLQAVLWDSCGVSWYPGMEEAVADNVCSAVIELDENLRSQEYRLNISQTRIHIVGGDSSGAFYATKTLFQILRQHGTRPPVCEIHDYPDFPARGVMLDISRDKVPTMETLYSLVDLFAQLKINQLQLYTEHTFAYQNHRVVWADASPMLPEEIRDLDTYCRERFIELVPNQQSFGHMHRWLRHPQYRHLAECPDGVESPWWEGKAYPFSLCAAKPEVIHFLTELYSELLPNFSSTKFNVCCDETFDLGMGGSKSLCEEKGKGRVYLEFVKKIHRIVSGFGRKMQFWGDIVIQHPDLVREIPQDVTVLEWGYEADHPFAEHGQKFAQSGIPFYVCPGTSTWASIAGRTDNCIANLRNAAENGLKNGASGYLICDWGDFGHLQYLPFSYPGFAAGAAFSWCYDSNRSIDIVSALNRHIFRDANNVVAGVVCELGNAYKRIGYLMKNRSFLFNLLCKPPAPLPPGVTEKTLRETKFFINSALEPLCMASMDRSDSETIIAEIRNAARMLLHACDRGLANFNSADLSEIIAAHKICWLARNREGGLRDSIAVLGGCG